MAAAADSSGTSSRSLRVALGLAACVIIVAGLRHATPVLIPIFLATFLAAATMPVVRALMARGVPATLAIALSLAIDLAAASFFCFVVGNSLHGLSAQLPAYQAELIELEGVIVRWLHDHGFASIAPDVGTRPLAPMAVGAATYLMKQLLDAVSRFSLVIIILAFMLFEAASLRRRLQSALPDGRIACSTVSNALRDVQRYTALKALVSLITGALVAALNAALGVPFPLMWGALAFVLNFIPVIGSIVAAIPPVLLALVHLDPMLAMIVALGYLVINVLLGNIIEPRLLGHAMSLSPLIVVVTMIFWGWMLGPVGMLLSVPLTTSVKLLLASSDDLRWLALLMSPDVPTPPAAAVEVHALPEQQRAG